MRLDRAMSIEDLRRMARRNVPGVFFEYMEAGSYSEHTRDANVEDMRAIKLRQRVLVDMSQRSLKTTVLGEELALPLAIAPTGLSGMQYADGEIHACRAAHAGRHPVHALHHVDLLDRGRGRGGAEAVLVPALRDARPRFVRT
jgi:isopentenyl diphosphate isomerase/L-lactate dehydrogenase-like FMN-dependent dehydrogenase